MINEDIRLIIEPELMDGEQLLWAEEINHESRHVWEKKKLKEDKEQVWNMVLGIVCVLVLTIFFQHLNWFVIAMGCICFFGFVYWAVLLLDPAWSINNTLHDQNSIAYAASNRRFFRFGTGLKLQSKFLLSDFEKSEVHHDSYGEESLPYHIKLQPKKRLYGKTVRLYFLRDFVHVNLVLNRVITENASSNILRNG